jgi:hypothetical protein
MRVALTDQQFEEEMEKRRAKMRQTQTDVVVGCPLCNVPTRRGENARTSNGSPQR